MKYLFHFFSQHSGHHFNHDLAHEVVAEMHHFSNDGKLSSGELIPIEEAEAIIDKEHRDSLRYDAYVAANAFAHDLARLNLSKKDILELAREFWFRDDDYQGESKIFSYFANR